jgi:hypothetical protein
VYGLCHESQTAQRTQIQPRRDATNALLRTACIRSSPIETPGSPAQAAVRTTLHEMIEMKNREQ